MAAAAGPTALSSFRAGDRRDKAEGSRKPGVPALPQAGTARSALAGVAVLTGAVSLVILVCSAVLISYWRAAGAMLARPVYVPDTAWRGLIDIGLLLIASLLACRGARWGGWPALAFWLAIFGGTWWSLMLPPSSALVPSRWPVWLTWPVWMQTAWAATLLAAVLVLVLRGWRRQSRAWPGDLSSLVAVSRPWAGLATSTIIVGLGLIPLGLWHAFAAGPDGYQVARLTAWSMAAAGLALSVLVGLRWHAALAELSLSLWTLALAALASTTAMQISTHRTSLDQLPVVHTGVLVGLTGAGLLWFWLAGYWQRQLWRGRPWTTAGRMLPLVDRVGFLSGSLAVLVGAKLALWPQMRYGSADDSTLRLVIGSAAYLLLVVMCVWAAWRVRKPSMLYLAWMAGMTWTVFLWFRW